MYDNFKTIARAISTLLEYHHLHVWRWLFVSSYIYCILNYLGLHYYMYFSIVQHYDLKQVMVQVHGNIYQFLVQ